MKNEAAFPAIQGYSLTEKAGSGSFGEVYKATRNADGATVAIKVLNPSQNLRRFHGQLIGEHRPDIMRDIMPKNIHIIGSAIIL